MLKDIFRSYLPNYSQSKCVNGDGGIEGSKQERRNRSIYQQPDGLRE